MRPLKLAVVVLLLLEAAPQPAVAGMPAIQLGELTRLRIQTISFFLVGFFLSAWGIQLLWNWLRRDLPMLPRLGYRAAVGAASLWGVVFVLILTMISGARELMTPGAWEKFGFTYRLAQSDALPGPAERATERDDKLRQRRRKLETLQIALWDHALKNGGLPVPDDPTIEPVVWQTPHPSALPYLYFPDARIGRADVVACEPELFGDERLVLLGTGEIAPKTSEQIGAMLEVDQR